MNDDASPTENATWKQKARVFPWPLLAILAVAAFLRLFALGSESFWLDEVYSLGVAVRDVPSIVSYCADADTLPPLYYIILHYWVAAFGQSEVALRSFSALCGIVSVLVIYRLGSDLFDRQTGLISAFLLAISAFAITYSQEARHYGLLLMLTLLSFFFFVKILRAEKPTITHFLCYSLSTVLLCYAHVYGLFMFSSQILYFLLFQRRYPEARIVVWSAQAVALLAFSPWIFVILTKSVDVASQGALFLYKPSLDLIITALAEYAGHATSMVLVLPVFIVLSVFGVLYFPEVHRHQSQRKARRGSQPAKVRLLVTRPKTALLLLWFFFPFLASLMISYTITPIFWDKYLIGITPALYILVARGIRRLDPIMNAHIERMPATLILVALIALLSLPGLHDLYASPQNEQWREVTSLVEQESQPDDVVVVCHFNYIYPFNHYYRGDLETLGIEFWVSENEELASFVDGAVKGKERLWLVLTTYEQTRNAPIKAYLLARYGSDSVVSQEEFVHIVVYLFDI